MYISFSVNCLFLFFTYFPTEFLDFSQFLEVLWEFRLSCVLSSKYFHCLLTWYVIFATKTFFMYVVEFVKSSLSESLNFESQKGLPHSAFIKEHIVFFLVLAQLLGFFTFIWLHQVLIVAHTVFISSCRVFHCSAWALSSCGVQAWQWQDVGSRTRASVVLAHGLSCFVACGIFIPGSGLNLHPCIARYLAKLIQLCKV